MPYEKAISRKLKLFERLFLLVSRQRMVLVHTMGKVGSSSIANTLSINNVPFMHTHFLTFIRRGSYFVVPKRSIIQCIHDVLKSIQQKIKIWIWFQYTVKRNGLSIISLIREPISRNISAFFEQAEYVDVDWQNKTLEELHAMFWEKANHDTPLIWFDKEIKKLFGIDVYSYPFNKEKGWIIIKKGNISLLIIQMEKINDLSNILGQFLGIKNIIINNTNRSSKKQYAGLYKEFNRKISIPRSYLDRMLYSRYTMHFYSNRQIKKWYDKYYYLNKEEK
ncbi:MAG: putative capsular polysaccharide synthesis family protein [Actinomycetia bacterium]|nr:putative capsular polysaccharide synthesis family protein [Actinomycetes bacterium]